MKVKELIEKLKEMPQDALVLHLYDGATRDSVNIVYEAKNGEVVTANYGEVCYETEERPKNAPTAEEDRYWQTPDEE